MPYLRMAKSAVRDFFDDEALRLSAALSYYTTLSLAPLLLVIISLVGLIFGRATVGERLVAEMQTLVGEQGAQIARTIIEHANQPGQGIVAMVIGVATLLFGATAVFAQLQVAMNKVWNVQTADKKGVKHFVIKRLLSLAMVLGIGFLLLVSLVISAGLSALNNLVADYIPGTPWLWQGLNLVASVGLITLLFAMIFKFLPDTRVEWRFVWVGALATAVLFTVGKFALGLYLGRGTVGSAYGAAGSLVVLLVWIYYSSALLFLGAEFTQVYAHEKGARLSGKPYHPPSGARPAPA